MSESSNQTIGAVKRQSDFLSHDSRPPEKRHSPSTCSSQSDTGSAGSPSIEENVSSWCSRDLFDKLLLNKQYIHVPDNDLTAFITDTPGRFQFLNSQPEEQEQLDTYFKFLNKYVKFDVSDAYMKIHGINYQYVGYDRNLDNATKTPGEVYEVFSDLETCFLAMENDMPKELTECGLDHLRKYCHYAIDFIEEATQLLMKPTEWQGHILVDLFRVFCRLSGLQLKSTAREGPRHFRIYGRKVSAQPDLRAYVPLDLENWWRQKPVSSRMMPTTQTLTAVCQVKFSPPNQPENLYDPASIEKETEDHLGQMVGDLLAELLSSRPFVPVAASTRTHIIGIMVLSTKVYFVKLHIPLSVMDMYRKSGSSFKDNGIEKGTVYVTQGFDFMKRRTRLQALKILHKIGTIIP